MSEQPQDREEEPEPRLIREDNWLEYEARGFMPVRRGTREEAEEYFGAHNIYAGDAWDEDATRPLRHKPGVGAYVAPEGIDYAFEQWRKQRQAERKRHGSESDDVATS